MDFSPQFYRLLNPELCDRSDADLEAHFFHEGWKHGCDPNALFSVRGYLAANPDVAETGLNPLAHYRADGQRENRTRFLSTWGNEAMQPYPFTSLGFLRAYFDPDHYRAQRPDLSEFHADALLSHYLAVGWTAGLRPNPDFDPEVYLADKPDLRDAGVNPFVHATLHQVPDPTDMTAEASTISEADLRTARPHFDASFYRAMNRDVEGDDEALLRHYLQKGWTQGRDPNPAFSTSFYLSEYNDISVSGINPFLHYLLFGKGEGRKSRSDEARRLPVRKDAIPTPRHLRPVLFAPPEGSLAKPPEATNSDRLRIHWVIPDFRRGGGGHMTIFRTIRYLESFGHECHIWIEQPMFHRSPTAAYETITKYFQCLRAPIGFVEDGFFEARGDAVIATGWSTAYAADAATGFAEKFYFVQDHEPDFYPAGTEQFLARATYGMEFTCLCASPWLAQLMQDYGRPAYSFHLAYDHTIYHPTARRPAPQGRPFRIAVYARGHSARRCVGLVQLGLYMLGRVRDDFEVHFFGQEDLPFQEANYPAYSHGVLSEEALAALYNDCDLGLCFSATNYSLVPQEMMACGLPVLELDTDSTRAVFPDGTVAVAPPTPQGVADSIARLIDAPESCEKVAEAGKIWASGFSWEASARIVEGALRERLSSRPAVAAPSVTRLPNADLDVVIPTWNGLGEIEPVIEALRTQRGPERLQIHCVDSSSDDGTTEWLRAQPDVSLTVIDKKEFQHGRTRNLGASLGRAPVIAFLTQDALPATSFWMHDVLAMMARYPKAAGLFGRHLPYPDHSIFVKEEINRHFARFLEMPLEHSRETDRVRWKRGDQDWRQAMHYYSDNNSAMRRDIWATHPYPEIDYGEDQVWAREIIDAGLSKVYAPTAAVYHSHDFGPDETFERAAIEAAFFLEHFGYRLIDGDVSDIEARAAAEQASLAHWAKRHSTTPEALDRQKANISAKYRGWAEGLRRASARR